MAATLLHHHVFMMPHNHLPVLIVQHGKWSQAGWHAGHTRDFVWVVKFQQALQRKREEVD